MLWGNSHRLPQEFWHDGCDWWSMNAHNSCQYLIWLSLTVAINFSSRFTPSYSEASCRQSIGIRTTASSPACRRRWPSSSSTSSTASACRKPWPWSRPSSASAWWTRFRSWSTWSRLVGPSSGTSRWWTVSWILWARAWTSDLHFASL